MGWSILPKGKGSNLMYSQAGTPSLDLRFSETKNLRDFVSGRDLVTFTRPSSATYFDSSGVLRTATTNLQRWSEDFTQGLSTLNATLTANQGAAPNGTVTADQYLETTANGLHSQEIADHVFIAGVTYTFSCYAKSIGGRNFAPGFPVGFNTARFGFFDLTGNGSVVGQDAGVTASIQAVGNGWYRCVITSTCASGGGARVGVFIANGTSISYAGDTSKGLLLWGAQLEQSSTVGEYIPTGATINSAPRFDHNPTTGESLGLLVEEQRTNLLLRSEEFGATWQLFRATLNQNTVIAPNGQLTADTLIEDTTLNSHVVIQTVSSLSNATAYAASCYVKASGRNRARILLFGAAFNSGLSYADFNLSSVTASAQAGVTASIVSAGGGWYRCSITATSSASGSTDVYIQTLNSVGQAVYLGNGAAALDIWGAQLEAGAFPTSYIPTTGSAATRSADVASITGTNFSSWYRQSQQTWFAEFSPIYTSSATTPSAAPHVLQVYNAASQNNNYAIRGAEASVFQLFVAGNPTSGIQFPGVNAGYLTQGTARRVAYAIDSAQLQPAANGVTPGETANNVAALMATHDILSIGSGTGGSPPFQLNGIISRLTYWPQRLPSATLQSLTL